MKVTLEQWRMFKAVADAGGFNQAADIVNKSQSSIHHAVHKLESQLGITLFTSSGRRIKLTESGHLMLRRANYLLAEATKLENIASTLQQGTESVLTVAVDIIFPPELLYSVLNKVSNEYPQLRVEVQETVLNGANAMLNKGSADIAITPFAYENGFSEDLCEIVFVAVAHPDHPLHHLGREINVEDLKLQRQIVVRDSSPERNADHGWLGAEQRWTVSHVRTSIDIISKGLGFAWLPLAIIQPQLERGELKALPLKRGSMRKSLMYLCFNDSDGLGPAARTFIGELRYHSMQLGEESLADESLGENPA